MKFTTTTALTILALITRPIHAIDLSDYDPQTGVDAAFTTFYTGLVNAADDPLATTEYSDYFADNATQQTLTLVARGPAAILAQKQTFLPPHGDISKFVHFPNKVTLNSDTAAQRIYEAHGRIERDFTSAGNCSVVYYKTRYTLLKVGGEMDWTPRNKQVFAYWDYYIDPVTSGVTDLACGGK